MIAVIMHVRTKANKTEEFIRLTTQLQRDVRANEPETLLFQVLQSPDDPDLFAFMEIFASEEARKSHARQPYHVAMSDAGYACLEEGPDIRIFAPLGEPALMGEAA